MQRQPILSEPLLNYLREISVPGDSLVSPIGRQALHPFGRRIRKAVRAGAHNRNRVLAQRGTKVPEMCFFSVTWRCNLECKGCYAKGLPTGDNLSPGEIESILKQTTSAGTVLYAIAGGEPLQVPGLLRILGNTEGGLFLLFTNGVLLGSEAAGQIARAGNILPVISIEGESEETDDRRGNGVGDAVSMAMQILSANRVPFAFSTMVSHRNLQWVTSRQYIDTMWDAGARFGFLVDYIPIQESYDPELVLTDSDLAYKRSAISVRSAERRPMVVNFPEGEYKTGGCMSAGNGFLHIGANGDVEPCTFSHYATHNLRSSSYLDALDSPFFRKIRTTFANRPNPSGTCMLFEHDAEVAAIAESCGACRTTPRPVAVGA